ncbi:MAG: hypothetical protein EOO92_24450 [Pedobacter sp.]|nr:MAG: hypothetical protein EOO92_24450 [Pedobacter sp.]
MKLQLDIKSLVVGFVGAALLITSFSFKDQQDGENGRYTTKRMEYGIIILDTKTGDFIRNSNSANENNWYKGSFRAIHAEVVTKKR